MTEPEETPRPRLSWGSRLSLILGLPRRTGLRGLDRGRRGKPDLRGARAHPPGRRLRRARSLPDGADPEVVAPSPPARGSGLGEGDGINTDILSPCSTASLSLALPPQPPPQAILGLLSVLASVVVGLATPFSSATRSTRCASREPPDAARVRSPHCRRLPGPGVFSYLQRMILVGMSRDIELEIRNQYFANLETQPPGSSTTTRPAT